ncbi:MarR family transcriptional regulator [Nakamurella flava]|uniref:MarR family transcriptional regulator n=1 Tax=Nakamurella flava TaxID=2576308 RepID=A0A4U6QJ37_9ACTN|nr:helix-turn-helix domain-containing protein [Nakamurella flava]TKV60281.1 MarR family transcriptional regulator [Nakamurella flava]
MSQRREQIDDQESGRYGGLDRSSLDRLSAGRSRDGGVHLFGLTPDDETLLAQLHRSRPASVLDAVELSHRPAAEVRRSLDRLEARGLVVVREDGLRYPHPAVGTADMVSARIGALRADTAGALERIERLVADLPSLLRQWSVGEAEADHVQTVTLHGPLAQQNLWFEVADHHGGSLESVIPDLTGWVAASDARVDLFAEAMAAKDRLRGLVPAWVTHTEHELARLRRFERAGVEFRTLEAPPGWFWVDGDQVALPLVWGDPHPVSVMAVRNAALADLARLYFDELWRRSGPLVPVTTDAWTPLLRLMRQGITLETASRMVGVNPRTGRRRIATAMEHYGVSTLFALGVAWATDGGDSTG